MLANVRDFLLAFSVRWFVLMGVLLGVPFTIGGYFITGFAAQIILFMAGISCIVFSSYWVWKVENGARRKAEALIHHTVIDIGRSFLCSDPPGHEAWRAKITPTVTAARLQACLDYSVYSGGIGNNCWGPRERLILERGVNFVAGAAVSIDLMELDNRSPTRFWRWATDTDGDKRPLMSITCHRCQLIFIDEQGLVLDYFDFFVSFHYEEKPPPVRDGKTPTRYEKAPSLTGEHQFLYAREWKNEGGVK